MYVLNIDTSGEICSVSVFSKRTLLGYKETKEKNSHASQLAPLTNDLLKELKIQATNLYAVAINKGPGSYTGLRIGTAFAKGLCYALNIPLIAIDGLKILAKDFLNKYPNTNVDYICPMLDARRMDVYTALFDKKLKIIKETQAITLNSDSFKNYQHKIVAFVGNGSVKFKFLANNATKTFLFYPELNPNSVALGHLSYFAYKNKVFEDIAYFEPQYLKDFIPTTPKNKLV